MSSAPAPANDDAPEPAVLATPFARVGGAEAVAGIVGRFYALMDGDPAYAALRAMHAPDLAPMEASLAGFLTAWLGGPRDWFGARPGACVMSLHRALVIGPAVADQWADAMRRAIAAEPRIPPDLALAMAARLDTMAHAMVNQA